MGQPIDIEGPLGGLSQNMSPRHIPPTSFVEAENVVNVAGVVRPRPGRTFMFAGQTSTTGGCFFDPTAPGAAFELALDESVDPDKLYYIFQAAVSGSPSVRSVDVDGTDDSEVASIANLGTATNIRGLRYSSSGTTSTPASTTVTATKVYVIQLSSVVLPLDVTDEFTVSVTTSTGTETTSALNPSTSAVGMRSAIVALGNVTNVTVTRVEASSVVRWTVTFVDPLVTELTVFPRLTVADSNPDITVTINGVQKRYTVVLTNLLPPDDGFTLSVRAIDNSLTTTGRLTTASTAAQVKAALEALGNTGTVTVTRTSTVNTTTYTMTFNASELNEQYPRLTVALLDVSETILANPGYVVAAQGGTYNGYLLLLHPDESPVVEVLPILAEKYRPANCAFVIGWPWVVASANHTDGDPESFLILLDAVGGQTTLLDVQSGVGQLQQIAWNPDDKMLYVTNSDFLDPTGAIIHQYKLSEFGVGAAQAPAVVSHTTFDAPYAVSDLYYHGGLRRLYFTTDEDVLGTQNVYFCPVLQDGVLGDAFQISTTTDALDHPRGIVVDSLGTVYWSSVRE